MFYKYRIIQDVVIEAKTKEEADRLLATENYRVVDNCNSYEGICNKEGKVYNYCNNEDK